MGHRRLWMAILTRPLSRNFHLFSQAIKAEDSSLLAYLMDAAYQGTIDHEGETIEQCEQEMLQTINGRYGTFVPEASKMIVIDGVAAAACLVTLWQGRPLIAFSMTSPLYQRRGLSRSLIEQAISALHALGEKVLYLVVTDGNTSAQELYRKIGFKELGVALPQTPPPEFKS